MFSLPLTSFVLSVSLSSGHGCGSYLFPAVANGARGRSLCSASILRLPVRTTARKLSDDSSYAASHTEEKEEEEAEFQVLTAVRSKYNEILIVDTPTSRMLLLDSSYNVHSIVYKGDEKWTGSYWDEFASLPAIVPEGPIAIYGLGGGTAAYLMLNVAPSLQLEGWEVDEILIDKAREYFGLSDLESGTIAGGGLQVYIGDALSASQIPTKGYAGIVIDLFSDGKVLAQLQQVQTWLNLKDRLMPNGRLIVNCGGVSEAYMGTKVDLQSIDGNWIQNSTIKALATAFNGQLNWKKMAENYLALTGPLPDLRSWSAVVPHHLSEAVKQWRSCGPFP